MVPGLPKAAKSAAKGAFTWRFGHNTRAPLLSIKPSSWEFPVPGSRMWACSLGWETGLPQGPVPLGPLSLCGLLPHL